MCSLKKWMGEIKDMLLSPLFKKQKKNKKPRAALSYISLVTQQKPGQSNDNLYPLQI